MTTKSTSASTSALSSRSTCSSGRCGVDTSHRSEGPDHRVLRCVEGIETFLRREAQPFQDLALVDLRIRRRVADLDPATARTQQSVDGLKSRIRARALEAGDSGLGRADARRELSLGEARFPASRADECRRGQGLE